jgi:pimeloyl-ACP methyl ester carboxylesterase
MTRHGMMFAAASAALMICTGATAASAAAQPELARRAALGVAVETGGGGARVLSVAPGSTAARAGLQPGDVVTGLNGATVGDNQALVAQAGKLRAGQPVDITWLRAGAAARGSAAAVARPQETYQGATARYGAVPFRGGLLRDILVTPAAAKGDGPVVFLIQGYYCATMEGSTPDHPYRALIQGLADRGIATYRVEKPGMGDSQGGPACLQSDFATELDAFRAGLATLTRDYGVDPGRVVLLGHSMGGLEAPLLAAEGDPVRGVAVYGTVLRNWRDYMQDIFRVQGFYSSGADPVELATLGEAMRPLLDRIFNENVSLRQIAADSPQQAQLLREALEWDGDDQILGRSAAYWRQIAAQPLTAAWRDSRAPVLAVYGEADFAAIDDRDHRLIADVVNHYRPGAGRFVMLAGTGHGFGLDGTREGARESTRAAGGALPPQPYNPELTRVLADWIDGLSAPTEG